MSSSPCARCPKVLGASCCEAGPKQLATLTLADVERIRAETGKSARAFVDEEWLTHEEAHEYETTRPLYAGYFARSPRRLTLKSDGARCVFHQPDRGCTLSAQGRPRACRLYPFEKLADGSWSVRPERHGDLASARESGGGCLAVEEADGMAALLAAFDLSPGELDALAEELRADVAEQRAQIPTPNRRRT